MPTFNLFSRWALSPSALRGSGMDAGSMGEEEWVDRGIALNRGLLNRGLKGVQKSSRNNGTAAVDVGERGGSS
ncbi:MAG: hypothetical protein WA885_07770 [Phormidesmis sp.]